jgi:hypothetical protein
MKVAQRRQALPGATKKTSREKEVKKPGRQRQYGCCFTTLLYLL